MHSFLVGAIFVAMVLAPCIAAMLTGVAKSESQSEDTH
jgi:hypothetical protein